MFLTLLFFSSDWINFQELLLQREEKRKDDSKDEEETEDDNNQEEYDPMEAEEAEDEDEGILIWEFFSYRIFFQAGKCTETRNLKVHYCTNSISVILTGAA